MMMSQAFSKKDINTHVGFDIAESKAPFNINDFNLDNYTPSDNGPSDSSDKTEEQSSTKKFNNEDLISKESVTSQSKFFRQQKLIKTSQEEVKTESSVAIHQNSWEVKHTNQSDHAKFKSEAEASQLR